MRRLDIQVASKIITVIKIIIINALVSRIIEVFKISVLGKSAGRNKIFYIVRAAGNIDIGIRL